MSALYWMRAGGPSDGGVYNRAVGDLSVTALYTSATWAWAEFPGAELLLCKDAEHVFGATNAVIWLASFVASGPSLRHSLVQRHALIDHLTRDAPVIVELAAGLSRRGVHRSAAGVRYTEVDLPPVVERKRALLAESEAGREALERDTFTRLEGDITTFDLSGFTETVIAEGLLMYLDAPTQRSLFERLPAAHFVFDLVPPAEQPKPGFTGRLLGWLMKRFTGGQGFIEDRRTRQDIVSDLLAAGFTTVDVLEPTEVDGFSCPHREEPTQVVVFSARRACIGDG